MANKICQTISDRSTIEIDFGRDDIQFIEKSLRNHKKLVSIKSAGRTIIRVRYY